MTQRDDYNPALDSEASYYFARACQLEQRIRAGFIKPSPERPHEAVWAADGHRDWHDLDTVRFARPRPTSAKGRAS